MPSRFYGADGIWVYGLKRECLQWFLSAEDLVDWLGESEYCFELDVGLLDAIEFAFGRLRQYARSLYVLNWIFKIIDKVSSCTRKFFYFLRVILWPMSDNAELMISSTINQYFKTRKS